jgi:hypothetical protein
MVLGCLRKENVSDSHGTLVHLGEHVRLDSIPCGPVGPAAPDKPDAPGGPLGPLGPLFPWGPIPWGAQC